MSHPVDEPGRQATHDDAGALRGPAQHVAADDVRRRAHGQPDSGGTVLGEVGRDLGARVSGADDEDVTTGVRATVAVVAGQHEVAGEAVEARPVGGDRGVVVAGGDDHVLGGERGAVVKVDQPPGAVRCGVAGRGVGDVLLEVRHDVGPSHPPAEPAWDPVARQARPPPRRVQVQPFVVPAPRAADLAVAVDDQGLNPTRTERGSRGQPAGSGTDDDDLRWAHAGTVPTGHEGSGENGLPRRAAFATAR